MRTKTFRLPEMPGIVLAIRKERQHMREYCWLLWRFDDAAELIEIPGGWWRGRQPTRAQLGQAVIADFWRRYRPWQEVSAQHAEIILTITRQQIIREHEEHDQTFSA